MSVLIKGMEMPKQCYDCDFCTYGFCTQINRYVNSDSREEDCPIIELPPHGRLIDADAFLAKMKEDPLFPLVEKYGMSRVIEAQPTIIPAEGKEADA